MEWGLSTSPKVIWGEIPVGHPPGGLTALESLHSIQRDGVWEGGGNQTTLPVWEKDMAKGRRAGGMRWGIGRRRGCFGAVLLICPPSLGAGSV